MNLPNTVELGPVLGALELQAISHTSMDRLFPHRWGESWRDSSLMTTGEVLLLQLYSWGLHELRGRLEPLQILAACAIMGTDVMYRGSRSLRPNSEARFAFELLEWRYFRWGDAGICYDAIDGCIVDGLQPCYPATTLRCDLTTLGRLFWRKFDADRKSNGANKAG